MSIESILERIAIALENPYRTDPTVEIAQPPIGDTHQAPDPETERVVTLDDVRAAVLQLGIGERESEARALMSEFGVEKIGEFKPEQYAEVVDKFNAVFHS